MRQYLFALLWLSSLLVASSAESGYKFRIELKDKGETSYTIDRPEEYLSQRAIERRMLQNIPVDESDLPVSQEYIRTIENLGCKVVAKSKWTETVTVQCEDSSIMAKVRQLGFVKRVVCVWIDPALSPFIRKTKEIPQLKTSSPVISSGYYGYAWNQMKVVNGQYLHAQGYEGEGIQIAVIDAGFIGLDDDSLPDNMNILGKKDFVYEQRGEVSHGFEVLSLMAANKPNL